MVALGPMVNASVGRLVGPQRAEKVPLLRIRQEPVVTVRCLGFSIVALGDAPNRRENAPVRRNASARFETTIMRAPESFSFITYASRCSHCTMRTSNCRYRKPLYNRSRKRGWHDDSTRAGSGCGGLTAFDSGVRHRSHLHSRRHLQRFLTEGVAHAG